MEKYSNIFIELLKLLKIKYTRSYAFNLYLEHPYRKSLYGLSAMLKVYGIESIGIRLDDKDLIRDVAPPFVAFADNEFVLVKAMSNKEVCYLWHNKWVTNSLDNFKLIWTGILLVIESIEHSVEPDYRTHKKQEIVDYIFSILLCSFIIVGCFYLFVTSGLWNNLNGVMICLLFLALYICSLLLQKQLNVKNAYAEKLCSLLKKSNCNNVLESKAAKLFNLFSWSEIGFTYFFSTLLIFLLFPQWIPYCAWIVVLTLPYTLWSFWYQRFKVKQWCPMCLIVMIIFWFLFIIHLFAGNFRNFAFEPVVVLWICILYLFPFLVLHQMLPLLVDASMKHELVYKLNRIKLDKNVFFSILKDKQRYDVSILTSKIVFGNIHANTLITIITNPHCDPCAKMHIRLESLLNKVGNKFCIQYIFSSFDQSLQISSQMLISAYMIYGPQSTVKLYNNWFKEGKYNKDDFFKKNELYLDSAVFMEFQKHNYWIEQNKLQVTPKILINGFELPEQYNIEDLELIDI